MRSTLSQSGVGLCCLIMVASLLAGCAGQPDRDPPVREDDELETTRRIARSAFDGGRYQQAAGLYQQTLNLALARDDQDAIVDARYNLAVALLNAGDHARALDVIDRARAELQRAGQQPGMDLLLLEATLLYRNGRVDEAWRVTESLLSLSPPVSADVARSTWFLRGLIAVRRQDDEVLSSAVERLRGARGALSRADYLELVGYQNLDRLDYADALVNFDLAAELRSVLGDYRGMIRTLAMAGQAAASEGDRGKASDYYLRAGRSAALSNDDRAPELLRRAQVLGTDAGRSATAAEAREYLESLSSSTP